VPNPLRVLIIAGDPLARAGLAALLGQQPGLVLAGQTPAGPDLPAALDAYQPGALVWDLGWDSDAALDALASLPSDAPPALALLPDDSHAVAARAAGARGLLLRDAGGGAGGGWRWLAGRCGNALPWGEGGHRRAGP
jgi:DNA-binding NarL/FixJ family response regulator